MNKRICIVAIVKDEEPFLDEWLFYHRLIGVDHFFLYDDGPLLAVKNMFKHHDPYLTVIDWYGKDKGILGRNNQTKAYWHALENHISDYEWVAYIDGDEFIVLPAWDDQIYKFLDEFEDASAVSLNWHVFGHNGYYDVPEGLITTLLTRRMRLPNQNIKTFTRTKYIKGIETAHFCQLTSGLWLDANHEKYNDRLYEGKTKRGFINHYQCRSFTHWMSRAKRGDVSLGTIITPEQLWRCDADLLLKKFVESIAYNKNEYEDEYMIKFGFAIQKQISLINRHNSFINAALPTSSATLAHDLTIAIKRITKIIMSNIEYIENNYSLGGRSKTINYILNYARFSNDKECEQQGLTMLNKLLEEINGDTPVNYKNGITGLGTQLEYLVQNCMIEANTDELLEDVDTLLQYHLVTKMANRTAALAGEAGIGKYFLSRIQNGFRAPSHPITISIKTVLSNMVDLPANLNDDFPQLLNMLNIICDINKHVDQDYRSKLANHANNIIVRLNFLLNEESTQNDFIVHNPLNTAIVLNKAGQVFEKNDYYGLAQAVLLNYETDYINHSSPDPLLLWLDYYRLSQVTQSTGYMQKAFNWLCKGLSVMTKNNIDTDLSIEPAEAESLAFRGLLLLYALDERTANSLTLYD